MIAEIGGAGIRLKFSFVAAVTLMLYFCEERVVLITFLASIIHESGHLILMSIYRVPVKNIELGAFGICIERTEVSFAGYRKEALIALGGIAFNLIACLLSWLLYAAVSKEALMLFAAVNLLVALFNSLPSFFLDMGRAVGFLLLTVFSQERTEKITACISVFTALMLDTALIVYTAFIGFNVSLFAVTVYLNLLTFKGKVEK